MMGREEIKQLSGMTERDLLYTLIERQANHKASHDELKEEMQEVRKELQALRDSRSEQKGAGKVLSWFAIIISALAAAFSITRGGSH